MRVNPCKDCTKQRLWDDDHGTTHRCHDTCDKFNEWKKELDDISRKKREKNGFMGSLKRERYAVGRR